MVKLLGSVLKITWVVSLVFLAGRAHADGVPPRLASLAADLLDRGGGELQRQNGDQAAIYVRTLDLRLNGDIRWWWAVR